MGSICGLAFTMWIAIGSYTSRPYSPFLNTSIAGCPVSNNTLSTTLLPAFTTDTFTIETTTVLQLVIYTNYLKDTH